MKRSKLKKIFAIVLIATMGISVLAGCGGSKSASSDKKDDQVLTYNLGADSKTLDPALNTSSDGGIVLANTFEGLCRLDKDNKAIPGGAEKWEITDDGLQYTFHLRKDAKWSNGEPVTANDYEFAWKRALNPKTGAEYAYQLYYIKNGHEYNTDKDGKISPDTLGIKALDDYTLQVTLESPTKYFLELTGFATYYPVNKKIVENNPEWATKLETFISNGPFKMSEWKIKDSLTFIKNENYYDKGRVKLDKLVMSMVTDSTSAWAGYQSGQFDMVDVVPTPEIQGALKSNLATKFQNTATYFYSINVSDKAKEVSPDAAKALSDAKVRKALNLAINRKDIVENVTKGEQIPAFGYIPVGMLKQDGKDFTDKEYFKAEGDVEGAKKLLSEAGYTDGKGFPTLVLMYNTEGAHKDVAQAVQNMWKENLGINVELQNQEWKVFQTTRTNKNYLIARHGWTGDYNDPMTFLDMWTTTSGLNDCGFSNPEYDKLVADAKKEIDVVKREKLMRQAEDVLLDQMPILPLYYYTQIKGIKSYVKGVRVAALGNIYFDEAYIEGK